jgi:hypothetical protein
MANGVTGARLSDRRVDYIRADGSVVDLNDQYAADDPLTPYTNVQGTA